jgi:hypothetical protein
VHIQFVLPNKEISQLQLLTKVTTLSKKTQIYPMIQASTEYFKLSNNMLEKDWTGFETILATHFQSNLKKQLSQEEQ